VIIADIEYQNCLASTGPTGARTSQRREKVMIMTILNRVSRASFRSQVLHYLALTGLLALAGLLALGTGAQAQTPLNEETHINNSLISAGVGNEIRQNCGSISARYFTVYRKTRNLEKYALSLGFSSAEIDAFLKSKTEQARVRKAVYVYLAANGVVKGDEAGYCALGKTEIANGSLTGQLLWAR
jgi:hypothetical protein